MKKNLHDDIDDFFSDRLKHYTEEPGESMWPVIDKRLSENVKNKPASSKPAILSVAAVIAVCLLTPFLLVDLHMNNQVFTKNSIDKKTGNPLSAPVYLPNNLLAHTNNIKSDYINVIPNNQNNIYLNKPAGQDLSVAETHFQYNKTGFIKNDQQQLLNCFNGLTFFDKQLIMENKTAEKNTASTTIRLSEKHGISIIPFFSADHISGRFIEQYEFDHEDEKDYQHREKPDFSFTAGVLAQYVLSNKFSIISGISVSSAALSISSTAVNALQDETGTYKFKLATSYGFAEISKSGIIPSAGDSLLVSDAAMKLKYISFPLLANYNFKAKKVKLNVHGGIAVNKIMSDKIEVDYQVQNNNELETINKIEGIKRMFFTVNAGIEAGYSITHNIEASLGPEIRYGINSINKGTPVKTFPVNYGLAARLHIKL